MKQADTKDVGKHYSQTKTSVEENDVRDMLTRLYNLEFKENGPTDRKVETSMSREDQKFMKILQEGTKLRNGHYQVPLQSSKLATANGNWHGKTVLSWPI